MKKILLLFALVMLFCGQAFSQWIKSRIFSKSAITCLAYNDKTHCLFAGTYASGLYKSIDGGATWTRNSQGEADTLYTFDLIYVGNRLVRGGYTGVFYSDDDGESWHSSPLKYASSFRFDPYRKMLYTALAKIPGYGSLRYSSDTAKTWQKLTVAEDYPILAHIEIDYVVICATWKEGYTHPGTWYMENQIYQSSNYGNSFGLVDHFGLNDLAMNDHVIIGINGYNFLYKSYDYGYMWDEDCSLVINGVKSIYSSSNRYFFIGGGNGGIFFSKDSAVTWDTITGNFKGVASNFIQAGDMLYVSSGNSIWKRNVADLTANDSNSIIQDRLMVVPNPNFGLFSLQIPENYKNDKVLAIDIYNKLGQKVRNVRVNAEMPDDYISLLGEPVGIYYIRLLTDRKSFSAKVILQH